MAFIPFAAAALGALYRERRYSAEQMARFRDAQLIAILEHARATTPLYRERIGKGPLPPMFAIPPITKAELMSRFDESISGGAVSRGEVDAFVADPSNFGRRLKGRYIVATTSGTTGKVGHFVTDVPGWYRLSGALFARILRHRLIPREIVRFSYGRRYRMAMTIATEGHYVTRLVGSVTPFLSRAMMNMRLYSVMEPLEVTLAALDHYRPHYLHAYPTFLESLARAQLQGRLHLQPEFISLGSEPISPTARALFKEAFPTAEVVETYATTECLTIANQCSHGRLHLNEDLALVEPVDKDGRPVPPGVPSDKVWVTNFWNRAQPLIRYELPDSVTLLEEPCPCGAGLRTVRVEGRADDTFFLADAQGEYSAHPPLPFESLFLNLPGLTQYQLVHESQNKLRVRFVSDEGTDADVLAGRIQERFSAYLEKKKLGGAVVVELERVSRIDREERGHKLRQVLSKVPRPALCV